MSAKVRSATRVVEVEERVVDVVELAASMVVSSSSTVGSVVKLKNCKSKTRQV